MYIKEEEEDGQNNTIVFVSQTKLFTKNITKYSE